MRQFPGICWRGNLFTMISDNKHYLSAASQWKDDFDDPVDLYDCRLRSWYIEAANSPKDIIILVDVSGSMTGQRKDIARNVVYNILDTLGTNDFVNIYKFSELTEATVPCFNISLVQVSEMLKVY